MEFEITEFQSSKVYETSKNKSLKIPIFGMLSLKVFTFEYIIIFDCSTRCAPGSWMQSKLGIAARMLGVLTPIGDVPKLLNS